MRTARLYQYTPMPSLDDKDFDSLRKLTGLRLVSLDQLHTHVAPRDGTPSVSIDATQRWCRRMESFGLLTTSTVTAAAPGATEPLLRFSPGDDAPDFGAVSKALRSRAEAATQGPLKVVRMTAFGATLLGESLPRASRRCELSHDLRMARFVLEMKASGSVASWVPEDQLAKSRAYDHVVPDGELVLNTGETIVVECGGIYSRAKLASFHARLVPQLERRGASGYIIV